MAKTNWKDPKSGEIISPYISGLQEAVGKLEESIGISSIAETGIPLSEVCITDDDRCRIYQAPEWKRNWLLSPAPIIKKNGTIITNDFEIDYGGGAVVFINPILPTDTLTADATYTVKIEGKQLSTEDYTTIEKDKLTNIELGANKTVVNNTLTSTSTTQSLSANQGKILDGKITDLAGIDRTTETVKGNSDNIATLQQDLETHKEDYASLFITNIGAKNSIYRGKYLGSSVTTKQYVAISSGTFEDLYIGDYWTIGGINWRIAAFDYYYNTGDSALTVHHIVIVPDALLYTHVMNDTNITDGGYINSKMHEVGLEQAKTIINSAFSSHVVAHRKFLCNASTGGEAIGGVWVDSEVELMNEIMVYGSIVNGRATYGLYNIGTEKSQLPLFALNPRMINTRQSCWLRDVTSAAFFAAARGYGHAYCGGASYTLGVRPAFSIS